MIFLMPRSLYLIWMKIRRDRGTKSNGRTYRLKKWKRSLMRRNDFLPVKNAWRALEMSWFVEYLWCIQSQQLWKRVENKQRNRLWEHSEWSTNVFPEMVMHPNEIERRRHKNHSVDTLDCWFQYGWQKLKGSQCYDPDLLMRWHTWVVK